MAQVTVEQATSGHPYSRVQIEEVLRDFDLNITEIGEGAAAVTTFDEDALLRILVAKGAQQLQPFHVEALREVRAALRKLTQGRWSTILAVIATLASGATAIMAFVVIISTNKAQSTKSNADLLSTIGKRIVDIRLATARAEAATDPGQKSLFLNEAIVYAADLDAQFELLDALHTTKIIDAAEWKMSVGTLCKPLHAKDYYGGANDLFVAASRVCEAAKSAGHWSP